MRHKKQYAGFETLIYFDKRLIINKLIHLCRKLSSQYLFLCKVIQIQCVNYFLLSSNRKIKLYFETLIVNYEISIRKMIENYLGNFLILMVKFFILYNLTIILESNIYGTQRQKEEM
jgi:hypothetical protein